MSTCSEDDCDREATVRLHIPWTANRVTCTAHARAFAQRDGVVAEPISDADAWP